MKVVVISKIPFLKQCRDTLRLEFGLIDYDELLDCLCQGVEGKATDRDHIRNMVYGDGWIQGHQIPYDDHLRTRLFRFLIDLRGQVINAIHRGGTIPYHLHIRYQSQFTSRMSLTFEVFK